MAITESPVYYYGHGEIWMGDSVAGAMPSTFTNAICQVDSLTIALASDFVEHVSKRTSLAKKDLKVVRMVSGTGKMVCSQHSVALLKKYLYASQSTVTGGAFAATAFANVLAVVGDYLPLPGAKSKVSSLVLTDSTGSPVTLTLGTHYEADADAGVVKILSLAGLTQPLKAAGTEAAGTSSNLLQTVPPNQGLRFKGISLTENGAIKIVDLPKIMISPSTEWGLLSDGNDVNKYEIDFEILEDSSHATFPYGRYRE